MTNEEIDRILIDNNTEKLFDSSSPLKLEEGYELDLNSVNINESKALVELRKNGHILDTKMIQPSIINARMKDKTYSYVTDLGYSKGIVQIAVHFKSVFHGADKDSAVIDGIFQLSDTVTPIHPGQQYDKILSGT